ncbi:MAG: Serralysin [Sphingomonas bacterium]|uniref:M10 family metallopeptidase C-terminal domain-containing protein n=1 Tax=Sphingomonas bacterium TaxID=1895847 RepID=UPI00262E4322|nr:M10 family metallopeptidase C-terminal domain-containing protein [Sphingomonas bacterium]MDB5706724.1 Serralysin [Sphingomonas bacterium]
MRAGLIKGQLQSGRPQVVFDRTGASYDAAPMVDSFRGGTTMNNKPSYTIDQAATQITRGESSWNGDHVLGTAATVTYAFRDTAPATMPEDTGGFSHFTATQIAATELALQSWSDVANISFVRVGGGGYADNAQILFADYSTGAAGAAAFADFPPVGDVWVNITQQSNISPTLLGYGRQTLVHEIGHTIGLDHPGDYDASEGDPTYAADAVYYEDSRQYSVMSYWSETNTQGDFRGGYASAPLVDDIAAAQRLYGANMTTRTGDTVYGFNSNAGRDVFVATDANTHLIFAAWDAGGHDTFDFSGYSNRQNIDLTAGAFSDVGGLRGNVAIAQGVVIEDAIGGSGGDFIVGNAADNHLIGNAGDDTLSGMDGNDTLTGGAGNNTLSGGAGADHLFGGDDRNELNGDDGDDILQGGAGYDRMLGGNGVDHLYGGGDGDQLEGNAGDDVLFGDAGNDYLTGGDGIDDLHGGTGSDGLYGGNDADTLNGEEDDDSLFGEGGVDLLYGGDGNDSLVGGLGADRIDGGAGTDTLSYSDNQGPVFVNLTLGVGHGNAAEGDTYFSVENVLGTIYADTIIGDDGANLLNGNGGPDVLIGSLGADVFIGLSAVNVELDGHTDFASAAPVDVNLLPTVSYEDNQGAVFVNLLTHQGYNNAAQGDTYQAEVNLRGSIFDDYFIGSNNANILDGGAGNDTLLGALGPDQLIGGAGNDTASYEDNQGAVFVNLTLGKGYGNAAEGDTYSSIENVVGTVFYDTFIGDANDNRLDGARGNDVLTGAGGADTFVFDTIFAFNNVDEITDFTHGTDHIELAHTIFTALGAGALSTDAFATGVATTAAQHILYDSETGALSYDADGSGAGAAIQFATLQAHLTVTNADFLVA